MLKSWIVLIGMLLLLLVETANAAPVLFNNAMRFDNHSFGLVDFDAGQSSVSEINTYLENYDAGLVPFRGNYFGTGSIGNPYQSYEVPISGSTLLGGGSSPGSYITMQFNHPVKAVGAFLTGWENFLGSPYDHVRVTLADSGGTYIYNFIDLLPSIMLGINGFFGVLDTTYGISEVQFFWNRDYGGIDNIYFGNSTTDTLGNGPMGVAASDVETIPLPTLFTVPIPGAIMLLGAGLIGLIGFRRKC